MTSNNQYGRGPGHNRDWDERKEQQHPGEHLGNRGAAGGNFTRHHNRNRGGFTGAPGSNYGGEAFGGAGQGLGFEEDKYRGYFGGGSTGGGFAASYSHSYGRDDYRSEEQRRRERHDSRQDEGDRQRRWESYDWEDRVHHRPESARRQEDGPHRGKGPRNYKRSDDRIREDVSDRLSDDPYVDASDIDIKVEDGNVILSGRVDHRESRRRAVQLAESVRGVNNVESHLRTGQTLMENVSHAMTAAIGDVTLGPDISTVETPKKGRKRK
jgi:HSP20 family molecular chaperone IbpA